MRKVVRTIIRKQLNEGKKMVQLQIPVRDKLKVDKILKKSGGKIGKHYEMVGDKYIVYRTRDRKVMKNIIFKKYTTKLY